MYIYIYISGVGAPCGVTCCDSCTVSVQKFDLEKWAQPLRG